MAITENWLRVSTAKDIQEFRPRRVSWKAPNQFAVSGLDARQRLNRVLLRFGTAEEASRASVVLKETTEIVEVPLPLVEEVPVEVRFLFTIAGLLLLIHVFFVRLVIIAFLWFVVFSALGLNAFFPTGVILFYVALFLVAILTRRKKTAGFLRFEGESLAVRTKNNWLGIAPKSIEWRSPTTFVLHGSGQKVEVTLLTEGEATKAAQKIGSSFPKAREIPSPLDYRTKP